MRALAWKQNLLLAGHELRRSTAADAAGLSVLMAEPDVEQWWHQGWDPDRWAEYVTGLRQAPDTLPLTLVGEGGVTGYLEVYRVAADVLGRHIQHTGTDLGIHIALGSGSRGHGLGATVIRGVLAAVPEILPRCGRLVAEPDVRNIRSHRAFSDAGFEAIGTVQLPGKTVRLMAAGTSAGRLARPAAQTLAHAAALPA